MLRNLDNLIDNLNDLRQDIRSQDAASLTLRLENARKGYERWWRERNTAQLGCG